MSTPSLQAARLTRGYAIALASAVILSTTGILIRYLTQTYGVPALVLAFWRDLMVVLTLLVVFITFRPALLRVERRHLAYLAGYGVVLALFNSMWTLSVSLNGAAVATVLAYTSGAFTALLGRWLLKERLDAIKLGVVALSLAGCVLVAGALDPAVWNANPLGLLTGGFSGLMYAVYSLMGRSASQRGLNPWTTLLVTFAFAAGLLLVFNLIPGGFLPGSAVQPADLLWLGASLPAWGILFLLAAGPTLLGFGLYNVSLTYLPSSVANLIVTLEPAFTTVIAYFVLGERLNTLQLAGSVMILAGVFILRIHEGRVVAGEGVQVTGKQVASKQVDG